MPMKTMTCKQLGGACELEFKANTFEEIAALSQNHAKEMMQKGDELHIAAMNNMGEIMKVPGAMKEWMAMKEAEFNKL